MAIKLFLLRNVPDDEAQQIRVLLEGHHIEFHETSAGVLGLGTAAIWIKSPGQLSHAKQLIAEFQSQRYLQARETYVENKNLGQQVRFSDLFHQNPAKVIGYIVVVLMIIYISIRPFIF